MVIYHFRYYCDECSKLGDSEVVPCDIELSEDEIDEIRERGEDPEEVAAQMAE